MVKIEVKDVSKIFETKKKKVVALESANLEVKSGESFGIVGPSGAGKTTLMRIIAGLDVPSKGEIIFNDQVMSRDGKLIVPPEKRHIGMVFQNWALYPNLTAFENIAFPLRSENMKEELIKEKIAEIAKRLEINHVISHFPRELSGGQQQRVSLARALVKSPSILILDEPFSNLDSAMRDSARAMVKNLQQTLGVTTLVVSHDPADIFSIATKTGVLLNGELAQINSPLEIYNNPVSLSVAKLVGEIITAPGTIDTSETSQTIKCANLVFAPMTGLNDLKNNGATETIEFGLRPEDVKLSTNDELDGFNNAGHVKVKISSYSGGTFKIVVSPIEDQSIDLYAFNEVPLKEGQLINFHYRGDRLKLFRNDVIAMS